MSFEPLYLEKHISGDVELISNRRSFIPNAINRQWVITDPIISVQLEQLYLKFGELNSYVVANPNIESYSYAHVAKEAVVSSRMDGLDIEMKDVFLPQVVLDAEKQRNWQDIQNYIHAFNTALIDVEKKPLSLRLFKKAHAEIFNHTRGKQAMAGDFRSFIPRSKDLLTVNPPHAKYIIELMGDLEEFILNENIKVPYLIRAAIMHYQIEVIKPFVFGNGQLARLMGMIYLLKKGVMKKPLLFPSLFMGNDRAAYYDTLNRARDKNDLYFWIRYYLKSMEQAVDAAILCMQQGEKLREKLKSEIQQNWGRRSQVGLIFLEHLFKEPAVQVKTIQEICDLSKKAANDLMKEFVNSDILEEVSGQERYRVFLFKDFVKLYQ